VPGHSPDDTHGFDLTGRGCGRFPVSDGSHLLAATAAAYDDDEMSVEIPSHLFVGIDHVGIAVPDLDEAIAFYRDAFGMQVQHEETNEEQGVREAMLRVGDPADPGDDAPCIQLLAPLNEQSTIAKYLDRSGPGLQQLAYRVADVDQVSAVLRERGLRLLYDEPRRGTADSRINFVHPKDAGGVLVELVEPAASGH
jgi:methylmalonyl-CoA/ethylmalonyl-CoA epimerase